MNIEELLPLRLFRRNETAGLKQLFETMKTDRSREGYGIVVLIWDELTKRQRLRNGGTQFTAAGRLFEAIDLHLTRLEAEGFTWPQTSAPGGDKSLDGSNWNADSPLSRMGYSVGATNNDAGARRRILEAAFKGALPLKPGEKQVWGKDGSGNRLFQIASHIATLTRNSKRRSKPPSRAIARWEADLIWLKLTFYDGSAFSFRWPHWQ